ncbi:DUF4112 domain-containing protein [Planctomicrobium sp. SH527]|uniref:DUF4112 domain-containing protein n=1 Tax=Planctomicrobium sp. SH527 TaxID=3448123 RepID=UPI003F5C555D
MELDLTRINDFQVVMGSKAATRAKRKLTKAEELAILKRIRALALALDNRFVIPGTSIRVGWDAIIGMIPGIGEVATGALSAYVVYLALQLDVPRSAIRQMLLNILVDVSAGSIPVVGDLFDVAWRANLRNVKLLERHLHERHSKGEFGPTH